ncbi:hypothetical protein LCGC14_0466190 [marine sediment metagenome]|uniref:3CxxC-type domain-containing protein n=1 Tax=marine sediment metagenome TaxID=412755 RepID=A0A0F9SIQ1_9ZZZZ
MSIQSNVIEEKLIRFRCDECEKGWMNYDSLLSFRTMLQGEDVEQYLYLHKCSHCEYVERFQVQYPRIERYVNDKYLDDVVSKNLSWMLMQEIQIVDP